MIIRTLLDLKRFCKGVKNNIVALGINPFSRLGAEDFFNNYQIVALRQNSGLKQLKDLKIKLIKKTSSMRLNTLSILKSSAGQKYFQTLKDPAFLVYRVSKNIRKVCQKHNFLTIGQYSQFEDKSFFQQVLKNLNLPQISSEVLVLKQLKWDRLHKKYRSFIVQLPNRSGGKGTYFVFKQKDFQQALKFLNQNKKQDNPKVLVKRFINGFCPSITGCVTRFGVLFTNPQLQIIDIPEVANICGGGIFCGHQWKDFKLNNQLNQQIYQQARKIGNYLKSQNYKGIFGLDFLVDQQRKQVFPLECNPRLLGSMPALHMIQELNQETPLIIFHILEFLGIKYQLDLKTINQLVKKKKFGAQLILTNKQKYSVINQRFLKLGVYTLSSSNKLVFVRSGYSFASLKSKKEFLITDNKLAASGTVFKPGQRILRIFILGKFLSQDYSKLNQQGKKIVQAIYHFLNFQKVNK